MGAGVFGIIAPHPPIMVDEVGGRDAQVTEASSRSMEQAAALLAAFDPDTVVIMSPHSPALGDAFVVETAAHVSGSLAQFRAPQVALSYPGDPELAGRLLERLAARGIPAIDKAAAVQLGSGKLDHGVLVPMSFLDRTGRWPLLVLSLSWRSYADHRAVGEEVAAAAADLGRKIAFVASGDCSHRLTHDAPAGYDPAGEVFDRRLVELIGASDFDALSDIDPQIVEAAGECGLRSFITLGGAAAPAHARVLSYEGPWGVGYLTAVVNEGLVTPTTGSKGGTAGADEHEIVALARRAIERYLATGEIIDPAPLTDPALPARAGAFVSLHRHHDLRGCIGTIAPTEPTLGREVVRNALQAATSDPRFPAMTEGELADLEISVDVLHEAEPATLDELDPKVYGVIVSSGWRRGLLLPDLEGVDTVDYQVDIARRKAGIAPGEQIELERFRVDRYT